MRDAAHSATAALGKSGSVALFMPAPYTRAIV